MHFARADARIDYLFIRGASRAGESARLFLDSPGRGAGGAALWPSDHIGVTATIRLP